MRRNDLSGLYKKQAPPIQLPCPSILRGLGVSFFFLLLHNSLMNILQRIFTDYYEEIKYTLHPRKSEMENIDKMLSCGDPSFGGVPCMAVLIAAILTFPCNSKTETPHLS